MTTDQPASSAAYVQLPHTPLVFLCPSCESELTYEGTRPADPHSEPPDLQDYFRCPAGCGLFEHDRRAHRMRQCEQHR